MHDYLFAINQKICDLKANNSPLDILQVHKMSHLASEMLPTVSQVVSLEVLRDDEEFISYVKAYNDRYNGRSFVSLLGYVAFLQFWCEPVRSFEEASILCEKHVSLLIFS